MATAVAVAIGSTAQGNVASASDTNYFKVQVVAGQKYTFQTVLGSLYDSVLTLLGTNGQTVIAQNDDMAPGNRASCITWQATRQRHVLSGREQLSGLAGGLVHPGHQRAIGLEIARVPAPSQPSGRLPGRSVALPSATLRPAAAAVVLSSNSFGAATSSVSNSSQGLDPAALDTLFHALGS